ncbi:MAG: hypothetical protein OEX02_09920 [Cyclobacteriaceae bacterium]|nr:hypothetical protein [Cyclobacteriaceae bacterium]
MDPEEKKIHMLLKSVIFYYHGLDEEERQNLEETANKLDAHHELKWAHKFISEDYFTAFDRAREVLIDYIGDQKNNKRVEFIKMVWEANNLKGYVTEMETLAMIRLAQDWRVQDALSKLVLKHKY